MALKKYAPDLFPLPHLDNFDKKEETVDGGHTTHSMAFVLYQCSHVPDEDISLPRMKRKSLDSTHCVEDNIQ